jgi:hypothetical protein
MRVLTYDRTVIARKMLEVLTRWVLIDNVIECLVFR